RVDEDNGQVGGRGARDHVAGVLLVARGVGDDELPPRGGEVAVRDVDRDALLALGPQPVGEQGEVDLAVAVAPLRRALHRLQLIRGDVLGVVEQAPDRRALAGVAGPRRGEAQELGRARGRGTIAVRAACGHQKYPSRLRSSMAASVTRSSARVSPRSVMRVAAISATTSSIVAAFETTPPVQLISPTVRKRTVALNGTSSGSRSITSDAA